jgi:hypothetical protein
MRKKLVASFLMLIGIFVGGLIYHFNYGTPWGLEKYKKEFEAYLEHKYMDDMTVETISYDFFDGTYHAYARSTKHPKISIYVGQNYRDKQINDGYKYEFWLHQSRAEFQPMMKELFPEDKNGPHINITDYKLRDETPSPVIPNYKERTIIEVGVNISNTIVTDENKQYESERIFKLVQYIKENKIDISGIHVSYRNKFLRIESNELESIKSSEQLIGKINDYK